MPADFRAAHPVATVHLQGMSSAAVDELAQGWPNAPAELVLQLCRLTDGNPLFLDELLAPVRLPGGRAAGAGRRTRPADLSPTKAIRELVARHVSRLPEDVVYLLQAAAVAGLECEAAIVAEAAELTHRPAARRVRRGRGVAPAPPRRAGHPDRYVFSHTLLRDAIYGELLAGRRVRYRPQDRRRHRAGARRCTGALPQRAGPPLLHGRGRWPTPRRPADYSRAAGKRALRLAGVRGGGGALRPRPGGGGGVRAVRIREALRRAHRVVGGAEPGGRHRAGGRHRGTGGRAGALDG